ncbi:nuclear transport factor 2 family protein [bacterium]|nr:nuclear transport factor 2 family protein [bacterium]
MAVKKEQEREAVLEAAAGFYKALGAVLAGDVEPMKGVWSHADDVTYMGPGGAFCAGWAEALKEWEAQAAMKLGGVVKHDALRVAVGKDLAVVENREYGEAITVSGKGRRFSLRVTSVFRKEKGAWKMTGHHTDVLSYMKK